MCGIVAYIGKKQAYPILIKGLQRLEYRGYDSAGVALLDKTGNINVYKCKGKVSDLEVFSQDKNTQSVLGMGHTRWATHGEPNDINAHPHISQTGNIALIHNGIIENYETLKKSLIKEGSVFKSQTDTEVLVHFIESVQKKTGAELVEAVRLALSEVVGAYAIVIIDKNNHNRIIAARKSSPLVVGVGKNHEEFFIGSDATPIVEYTHDVIYLNDHEIAVLDVEKGLQIIGLDNKVKPLAIQELELELESIEKGGFEHFMLKEIYEQPRSVQDSLRGRLHADTAKVTLGGIRDYEKQLADAKRITIVACGTSWIAGLVGKYIIEEFARIPVDVDYGSEFRYRNPIIQTGDFVLVISQSGETADTLAAIELAKSKGATVLGICNVVGSSISRNTHAGIYTHAGPEIGVASTKAFTAQVAVLTLLALRLAELRGSMDENRRKKHIKALQQIPAQIEAVLKQNDAIKEVAKAYQKANNALYLGRGVCFPVALEGALKIKEISYIHAEGYPAAEMKHGPIALVDESMPVVVIANQGTSYEKIVSNIQEVKARKGKIIALVTEGDEQVRHLADHVIEIPATLDALAPLVATVPLQLLAYHMAVLRGCNVDQPRNLAKSVTVE
jgi:glucosamine--fructose-6-phosphate aminotransferase (isomerizing)